MSEMRVNKDKQGRICIYMPAYIRDKFKFENGDHVEVDTDGSRIILTKIE